MPITRRHSAPQPPDPAARARVGAGRPAFTLIELITVVVILAVLSSLVVPRVINWDERRAESGVQQVADVLSGAARRHLFSTQRLAIDFADGRLRVLTLRLRDPGSFSTNDQTWLEDPLTPGIQLTDLELIEASADGRALPAGRFRVELPAAEPRPEIVLRLAMASGRNRREWIVHLPPTADRAAVTTDDDAVFDARLDLDRAGLRDEPW